MAIQTGFLSTAGSAAGEERETLSVHWRAVFAGVFITVLVYITLMTLGLAVGATGLERAIQEGGQLGSLGRGAGLWAIVSVLLSLFAGSYAAGRVSGIVVTRIGYTQGAVISSLFFILMLSQIGVSVGLVGLGLGGLTSNLAGGAMSLAQNPRVVEIVEDATGDLSFRSRTEDVIAGVLSRLEHENSDAALNYLASQAQISPDDAAARLRTMNERIRGATVEIAKQTSAAAQWLGWSAFAALLLGSVSAMIGGGIGAQVNMRKPIAEMDRRVLTTPATVPL